jgi:fatty-acyl-CoA synthase
MTGAALVKAGRSQVRAETDASFVQCSVGELLRDAARQVPDRIALIGAGRDASHRWTYAELLVESEQVARALLARFEPGDRVATWASGNTEIVRLHLGAALAGIVLVTLNPANRAAELEYLLAKSEARGIFLDRTYRGLDNTAVIEGLRPALPKLQSVQYIDDWAAFLTRDAGRDLPIVEPEAPALLLFTSGTTGKPKGAVLRHSGIVNNARLSMQRLQIAQGGVWLNVLPMFHVGGSVTMTLGCLANLGTQVLLAEFSAETMLDTLQRYGAKVTMAVPTMLIAMLQSPIFAATDLSKLEVVVTGGTVVAPELVRSVKERFGAEVMVLFGQTEAGGCMCLTRRGDDLDRVTQSVGTPLPLSEAKIVSETGAVVPLGEIGEICVRTRCRMSEYFGQPEKTAEAIDAEGWVHTGDLGIMRPDGYLQVSGRLKDMIIRGGENIYPREIEDALAEHPAISQVAVFGIPDPKWGEQVAAAVILKPGQKATDEELTVFLQARMARHKVPKTWHFVERLPINASGKIQKFVLREQFGST